MLDMAKTNTWKWIVLQRLAGNYKISKTEKNYYIIFLQAMFIGISVSLVIEKFLWQRDIVTVHTALEVIPVIFNMSSFFIVWNKYTDSPTSSKIIAFALLSTTIFDFVHIYCFEHLFLVIGVYSDLTAGFWLLGRFTEIIMIFTASFCFNSDNRKLDRRIALIIALLVPVIVSCLSFTYGDKFPALVNNGAVTVNKIILEAVIVALAILSLLRHKRNMEERGQISYKYLALSILVMIPMEISFMMYSTYYSPVIVYGHVFRIVYSYFLYKSIFQSSLNFTHRELEESRRELSNILDSIPVGIQAHTILNSMKNPVLICDNKGSINSVNKAFEELFQLSRERLTGMKLSKLIELINYQGRRPKRVLPDDESIDVQFEANFTNAEGIKKEILVQISNIINVYSKSVGKFMVVTDITGLKEQQQKIIHNEKLALLGHMGAAIVHETRNYLTTIKGCGQIIEVMSNQEKVIQYAKKINANTDEVNRIISDFLSLSKPRQAIKEEVAICDLIESIENILGTASFLKGVHIQFISNIDERYILCDEAQMRQVVLNMCKNAVEAMGEELNPKLLIQSGIKEEDNSIYIKISDNGRGMDKETLTKIGTPFFTTKHSGTGLGLSVCYNIVRDHGGFIDVISEEGKGTTFTISLPGLEDED